MMIRKIFSFKDRHSLHQITLKNIQEKMYKIGFNKQFTEELMVFLQNIFDVYGDKRFQQWFIRWHYRIPEEFKDESLAVKLYEKHSLLIEEHIEALEKGTKSSWEIQTEDLKNIDEKARKSQLVIRNRLWDIALDLLN